MKYMYIIALILLAAPVAFSRDLPSFEQTELNCENIAYANYLSYWQKKGLVKYGSGSRTDFVFKGNEAIASINSHLVNKDDVYVETRCDYNIRPDQLFANMIELLRMDDNALIVFGLLTKTSKGKSDGHGVAIENISVSGKVYEIVACSWGKKFLITVPLGTPWIADNKGGYIIYGSLAPGFGSPKDRDAFTMEGNTVAIDSMRAGLLVKRSTVDSNVNIALSYMKKGEFIDYAKLHPYFRLYPHTPLITAVKLSNKELYDVFQKASKEYVYMKDKGLLRAASNINNNVPEAVCDNVTNRGIDKDKSKEKDTAKRYATESYTDPKTGITITRKIEIK